MFDIFWKPGLAKHGMEADVKFEVQDATQIEYPNETFDVIYSR